jgi:hypothetical protein
MGPECPHGVSFPFFLPLYGIVSVFKHDLDPTLNRQQEKENVNKIYKEILHTIL